MKFIITKTSIDHLEEDQKKPCKEAFRTGWGVEITTFNELYKFIEKYGSIIITIVDGNPKIEIYDQYREG